MKNQLIIASVFALGAFLHFYLRGPSTSGSADGLPSWPIFKVAIKVGEFFRSAHLASNPGPLLLLHHGISFTSATALYVVAKLGVADVIKDGSVDYNEIATQVGVKAPEKLFRSIRYLVSEGIFVLKGNNVSLTPSGQALRSDRPDSMRWCMIHWNEEVAESMHHLLNEVITGEEAFVKAHGDEIFNLYETRPASAESFTKCMMGLFSITNPACVAEYDFSIHNVLLDYGGGMGMFTKEVLKQHDKTAKPNSKLTQAIVFDLEKVVVHGSVTHPLVQYRGGDFFEPSTIPTGADVILINNVLHDWNDAKFIEVITNAKNALAPGKASRVVVVDAAIPDFSHPFFNSISRMDVFMMTVSSGFFRTPAEYNALWPAAGLRLVGTRSTRSLMTVWILERAS